MSGKVDTEPQLPPLIYCRGRVYIRRCHLEWYKAVLAAHSIGAASVATTWRRASAFREGLQRTRRPQANIWPTGPSRTGSSRRNRGRR